MCLNMINVEVLPSTEMSWGRMTPSKSKREGGMSGVTECTPLVLQTLPAQFHFKQEQKVLGCYNFMQACKLECPYKKSNYTHTLSTKQHNN